MLRKDYLVSQIEELARFMAKLLASLSGLNFDDALKTIEAALAERGIRLQDVINLEVDELIVLLKENPAFNHENIENLSDILSALGDNDVDGGWRAKSLALLQHIDASEKIFSFERNGKIGRLKSLL